MSAIKINALLLLMLLPLAAYFIVNDFKIDEAVRQFQAVQSGEAASKASIFIDDELVISKRFAASEIFDAKSQRQVVMLAVTAKQFEKLSINKNRVSVRVAENSTSVQVLSGGKLLVAELPVVRLFIVRDGDKGTLAGFYWQQQKSKKNIVECVGDKLCNAIRISSRDWTNVEGPYLDTDLNVNKSGLPRGRWVFGPKTVIKIEALRAAKVAVLVTMLGAVADQTISFSGAVTGVRTSVKNTAAVDLGDKRFYPKKNIVELQLQRGVNELVIEYSTWRKSTGNEATGLAAFITAVKIKEI